GSATISQGLFCLAKFFKRDGKRTVTQILGTHIPGTGKAIHVCNGIGESSYDVSKPFQVLSQDEMLDLGLLSADVKLILAHRAILRMTHGTTARADGPPGNSR